MKDRCRRGGTTETGARSIPTLETVGIWGLLGLGGGVGVGTRRREEMSSTPPWRIRGAFAQCCARVRARVRVHRCLPYSYPTLTHPCMCKYTVPSVCALVWVCMCVWVCVCLPVRPAAVTGPTSQHKHQENSSEHNHWITQDQIQWLSRGLGSPNKTIRQNTHMHTHNWKYI